MLSETAPSTSSTANSTADDVDTRALKLLGEGKRHVLVGDAPTAVTTLQEACEILATKYGEISDQCAETYYQYGNALLELGRMESGVLGNALDGAPDTVPASETEDETEGDKIEKASKLEGDERKKVVLQVKEALEATYKYSEVKGTKKGDSTEVNDDATKVEKATDGVAVTSNGVDAKMDVGESNGESKTDKQSNGDVSKKDGGKGDDGKVGSGEKPAAEGASETKGANKETKDEGAGTSGADTGDDGGASGSAAASAEDVDSDEDAQDTADEENKEENPDDIPNFQLAWEMLELSRIIFSRKTNKEFRLKVAQVHFKLGELGLETEQYAQSLDDFGKCLQIQKEHLEPESRLIAGSHYNLGLAYSFDSKLDQALNHFNNAKKTIEVRVLKLESDIQEKEAKKEEDLQKTRQEISELNELIPDIIAKIEDAKDGNIQSNSAEGSSSSFDQPSSSSAGGASTATIKSVQVKRKSDNAPVSDISHLVKRKKMDASVAIDTNGVDAIKENGAGDADTKQVNGTSKMEIETTTAEKV